jgi:hypothetical protein
MSKKATARKVAQKAKRAETWGAPMKKKKAQTKKTAWREPQSYAE